MVTDETSSSGDQQAFFRIHNYAFPFSFVSCLARIYGHCAVSGVLAVYATLLSILSGELGGNCIFRPWPHGVYFWNLSAPRPSWETANACRTARLRLVH